MSNFCGPCCSYRMMFRLISFFPFSALFRSTDERGGNYGFRFYLKNFLGTDCVLIIIFTKIMRGLMVLILLVLGSVIYTTSRDKQTGIFNL
jgi:hypothetical protein